VHSDLTRSGTTQPAALADDGCGVPSRVFKRRRFPLGTPPPSLAAARSSGARWPDSAPPPTGRLAASLTHGPNRWNPAFRTDRTPAHCRLHSSSRPPAAPG